MSELKKTIIIPGDDASTIVGKPILKMVVLGDYPDVAKTASRLAKYPPTEVDRHVIWFKSPSHSELKKLFSNLDDNIDGVVAFSVSTTDKVADYVKSGETLDNVRIDQAFTNAGLSEFNK